MDYSYDYGDLEGFDGLTSYEGSDDYDFDDFDFSEDDISSFAGGLLGGVLISTLITAMIIGAIAGIFMIIANWKMYTKMNKPGWAVIIPFYSQWVLFEAVGMPGWYSLLALIPGAGAIVILVFMIMAYIKLAKCFGKDGGFAVGLILIPIVFIPILAFGKATYTEPVIENQTN